MIISLFFFFPSHWSFCLLLPPAATQVLITVAMVNEGFDSAAIDCVVMGRLTESEIMFVQQVRRESA